MRKYLLSAAMIGGMVLAAGNHPVWATAILTIDDQAEQLSITHSLLPITITATETGPPPIPITVTQGAGVGDVVTFSPESLIGGVFNFSGTWVLSAGTAATTGSFAQVAYDPDGSVSDLLTWTVASAGQDADGNPEASISGTFCSDWTQVRSRAASQRLP